MAPGQSNSPRMFAISSIISPLKRAREDTSQHTETRDIGASAWAYPGLIFGLVMGTNTSTGAPTPYAVSMKVGDLEAPSLDK